MSTTINKDSNKSDNSSNNNEELPGNGEEVMLNIQASISYRSNRCSSNA